jgi:hypothetical protein
MRVLFAANFILLLAFLPIFSGLIQRGATGRIPVAQLVSVHFFAGFSPFKAVFAVSELVLCFQADRPSPLRAFRKPR